jgi:hypothetical protein
VDTLVVSGAPPERLLFLRSPARDEVVPTGPLMLADLSARQPVVTALPGSSAPAKGVPAGGFHFGQTGAEILFIEDFDAGTGTGTLAWSNGAQTTVIGSGAALGSIALSADRSKAIAAVRQRVAARRSPVRSAGDLVSVDMATGHVTPLDAGATVQATAYAHVEACEEHAPTGGDCSLRSSGDLAFSMSEDARVVASEVGGTVHVTQLDAVGGVRSLALGHGRFPGVSTSGARVAFFDADTSVLSVVDLGEWLVNPSANPRVIATVPAHGQLSPVFSPDGEAIAFLEDLRVKGKSSTYGGDLGTVQLLSLSTPPRVVRLASNALWHSLAFWPRDTRARTSRVTVLGNLSDPFSGSRGAAGVGTLVVENLAVSGSATAGTVALEAGNVSGFSVLPASGRCLLISPQGIDLWVAGAGVASTTTRLLATHPAGGASGHVGRVQSQSVPAAPDTDEVVFQVDADLWGLSGTGAQKLMEGITFAALAPDGRVLALHPTPNEAEPDEVEIWSLPFRQLQR